MKKGILLAVVIALSGCASMGAFLGEPDIKLKGIAIEYLDLEGIMFRCDYVVKNPYPIGITISQVATDIIYEDSPFVQLVTDEGLNLGASSSSDNSMLFKVPYDSLFELAGESRDRESLPFTLKGEARFDLSSVPYLENQSLTVPFQRDFDVPLFKPQFRLTGGKVQFPPAKQIAEALVTGGLNMIKATIMAGKLALGQPVEDDLFEGVDLDVTILFDLEVDNQGGAPWTFELERCSIDTGVGSLLEMELQNGTEIIDSTCDRLQMVAVVNTLEWGAFIAGMAGGNPTGSELVLESSLGFPGLHYERTLPLNIEQELSLSGFVFTSK